jgi:hypothetical protein
VNIGLNCGVFSLVSMLRAGGSVSQAQYVSCVIGSTCNAACTKAVA